MLLLPPIQARPVARGLSTEAPIPGPKCRLGSRGRSVQNRVFCLILWLFMSP